MSMRGLKFCVFLGALAAADACASDFDMQALAGIIRTVNVRSVEEMLPLLPSDLRANYTLAFASRSLQGATPSAPRAILFGSDARFIVTFNGDAGERGYDVLETMQFDERSNSFHFREVSFQSGGGGLVSEDNPARCAACHGRPARPIWDTAPSWPGIYGERYRAGLSKAESIGMTAFLARQPNDPRYRHLIGARQLGERATYVPSAHALYNGASFDPPNARLARLLATMNVRALASELSDAPAFAAHRYVLLEAAGGTCGSLAQFFPGALQTPLKQSMRVHERSSVAAGAAQEAAKRLRRASTDDAYHAGLEAADPIAFRFIAEQLVGLPRQRWSLAMEGGTFDLAAPDGALSLEQLFFERLAVAEPELRELRSFRSFSATDAYCEELRKRSRRELTAFYGVGAAELRHAASLPAQEDIVRHPALLDHCVACHDGEVGPAFPFGDPVALAPRLIAGGYAHGRLLDEILYRLAPQAGTGRMPRDVIPTPAELRDLEDYFVNIAASSGPVL
jgi:mono/diheme cytochrome c family protein